MAAGSGEESGTGGGGGGSRSEILSRISKMGQPMLPMTPPSSAAAASDHQVSSSVYRYQSDQAILYDICPIIVMSAYTGTVEYYYVA